MLIDKIYSVLSMTCSSNFRTEFYVLKTKKNTVKESGIKFVLLINFKCFEQEYMQLFSIYCYRVHERCYNGICFTVTAT